MLPFVTFFGYPPPYVTGQIVTNIFLKDHQAPNELYGVIKNSINNRNNDTMLKVLTIKKYGGDVTIFAYPRPLM